MSMVMMVPKTGSTHTSRTLFVLVQCLSEKCAKDSTRITSERSPETKVPSVNLPNIEKVEVLPNATFGSAM